MENIETEKTKKRGFWQRVKAFFGIHPKEVEETQDDSATVGVSDMNMTTDESAMSELTTTTENESSLEEGNEISSLNVAQSMEIDSLESVDSLLDDIRQEILADEMTAVSIKDSVEPFQEMTPEESEYRELDMESLGFMEDAAQSVYMNRELSWIKFNERVLEEAENPEVPLCERLTFASIYQTNLDEFFMVRVGKLIDKNRKDPLASDQHTNMTSQQQIDAIFQEIRRLAPRRDGVYRELMNALEEQGIRLVNFRKIDEEESKRLEKYFDKEIKPLVEPNIVGAKQPFPFLQNEAIYAAAILITKSGNARLGIIPCSTSAIPRLISVGSKPGSYMLTEELILHFLPKIFKEYTVKAKSLIRITRSGNIDADKLYNHDLDYREFMAEMIRKRKKLPAVRLELSTELEKKVLDIFCTYLKIDDSQVFVTKEPLDLSFVFQLQDALRNKPELFYKKRVPQRMAGFDPRRPIFDQLREKDLLLSYPYHSMTPFLSLLRQAAFDENVLSIKMTLYRVSKESKVIEYLCDAAEHGKEVLVLVELKARFDEEHNVAWSRQLEAAGCRVIYGIPGYKVHSKLLLITRREHGVTEYFTQVGTGNYNEKTARMYTDLCLMTSSETIGKDAVKVFQDLIREDLVEDSEDLMVAPHCLAPRILKYIDEQIRIQKSGGEGYLGFKVNSLGDKRIIEKLVEASRAGVKVDIIVRGICCLIPGIPGLTDNIRVISIVGRYLEHARIYIFGKPTVENPQADHIYISSADFLDRNTMHRVEVAAPIHDGSLKAEIRDYFQLQLSDNVQAREMLNDGTYLHVHQTGELINSQEILFERAYREIGERLPEETILIQDDISI